MNPTSSPVYRELKNEDSSELNEESSSEHSLLGDEHFLIPSPRTARFFSRFSCNVATVAVLVAAFVGTNLLTGWVVFASMTSGNNLLKLTSGYSPIFDRVHIPLHEKELHIPVFPNVSDPTDIYRLAPSPEVDAAWDRVSNIGLHSVSEDDIRRLGKDPATAIRTPEEWWSAEWGDGWMVEIDVFHQIHCLNAMRKGLVFNYEHYWGARYGLEPPVMFAAHINHCMGALLQNLMCHADVDPVTYNWRKTQQAPFPDFAVNKKCRDFDALLEWQEAHKLRNAHNRWYAFKKPQDAIELEIPPGLTELGEGTGHQNGQPTMPLEGLPPQCKE